jgi:hypothetical protein
MAQKSRFYKTTKGFNAEVIVAKATAYCDDANYAAFVANALDGEIGVFNADTNLNSVDGVFAPIAMPVGTRFFIAQKKGKAVFRTTPGIIAPGTTKRTAYTAPVKQVSTVTLTGYAPVVGDELSIKFIETTPGNEQFPTNTYNYTVKAGDTLTLVAAGLVAQINSLLNLENSDGRKFVSATNAVGVITITADFFGSSFRIATPGKAFEVASVAYTVPYKEGSGYSELVARDEIEGQIYDGVNTQYPGGVFAAADFGSTPTYTVDGTNYHIYNFTPFRSEATPTPVNLHHHKWNAILAVPTAGGPAAALTTIFGV